jgi:hypothetical protein
MHRKKNKRHVFAALASGVASGEATVPSKAWHELGGSTTLRAEHLNRFGGKEEQQQLLPCAAAMKG